jgi:hypothetical protein
MSNAAVLVPTFKGSNHRIALSILYGLFLKRSVVEIHSVDLVWEFGTIHCSTQQQSARNTFASFQISVRIQGQSILPRGIENFKFT